MVSFRFLKFGVLPLVLTGCGSITGLENAQSDFACSVEMPAQCASMTQVHEGLSRTKKRKEAFSNGNGESKHKRASGEITERIVLTLDKDGVLKEKPISSCNLVEKKKKFSPFGLHHLSMKREIFMMNNVSMSRSKLPLGVLIR